MFYYYQTKDVFCSFELKLDGEILRCIGNKLRAEYLMYLYHTPMEVRTKKEMLFTINTKHFTGPAPGIDGTKH